MSLKSYNIVDDGWKWSTPKRSDWTNEASRIKSGANWVGVGGEDIRLRAKTTITLPDYGINTPEYILIQAQVPSGFKYSYANYTRMYLCRYTDSFDPNSIAPNEVMSDDQKGPSDVVYDNRVTWSYAYSDSGCTNKYQSYATAGDYVYFKFNLKEYKGNKGVGTKYVIYCMTFTSSDGTGKHLFSVDVGSTLLYTTEMVRLSLTSRTSSGITGQCTFSSTTDSGINLAPNTVALNNSIVPKGTYYKFLCTPADGYQYETLSGSGDGAYSGGYISGTLNRDTSLILYLMNSNVSLTFDLAGMSVTVPVPSVFSVPTSYSKTDIDISTLEDSYLQNFVVGNVLGERKGSFNITYVPGIGNGQMKTQVANKTEFYKFLGWSLSPGGSSTNTVIPDSDKRLYAVWGLDSTEYSNNEVEDCTFNPPSNSTLDIVIEVKDDEGNDVQALDTAGDVTYKFRHWVNENEDVVEIGGTLSEDTALSAVWEINQLESIGYDSYIEAFPVGSTIMDGNQTYRVDGYSVYDSTEQDKVELSDLSLNTLQQYLYKNDSGNYEIKIYVGTVRQYYVSVLKPEDNQSSSPDWVVAYKFLCDKGTELSSVAPNLASEYYSFVYDNVGGSLSYDLYVGGELEESAFALIEGGGSLPTSSNHKYRLTIMPTTDDDGKVSCTANPPTIVDNAVSQDVDSVAINSDVNVYLAYEISKVNLIDVSLPYFKGYFTNNENNSDLLYFPHYYEFDNRQRPAGGVYDIPATLSNGEVSTSIEIHLSEFLPPSLPNVYIKTDSDKWERVAPDGNTTFGEYFPSCSGTALYIKTEDGWKIAHSVYIMVNIDGKKSFETYATKLGESSQNTLDYGVLDKMVLQ